MDTRTFEEIAEGQLSVKLIEHHEDGSETWIDFPLGVKTVLLDNEEMAVFDSRLGTYARFNSVVAGREAHDAHIARLKALVPVIPEFLDRLQQKLNRKFTSQHLIVNKRSDV